MEDNEDKDILGVFMEEFNQFKTWVSSGKRAKDYPGALSVLEDSVRNKLAKQRINITLPLGFKEAWADYESSYSRMFRVEGWTEETGAPHYQKRQQLFDEWLEGLIHASDYYEIAESMQAGTGYGDLRKSFWRWGSVEHIFPAVPEDVPPADYERHHLFVLLQQAHRAIVFGAPFAAIAAMRAALEDLLRNWLKVPGKDLKELLANKEALKLSKSSRKRLQLLRRRANAALHIGSDHRREERSFVADMNRMTRGELSDADDARMVREMNRMLSEINALVQAFGA